MHKKTHFYWLYGQRKVSKARRFGLLIWNPTDIPKSWEGQPCRIQIASIFFWESCNWKLVLKMNILVEFVVFVNARLRFLSWFLEIVVKHKTCLRRSWGYVMNSVNVFIRGANSSQFLSSYFYYFQESLLSDSHLGSPQITHCNIFTVKLALLHCLAVAV